MIAYRKMVELSKRLLPAPFFPHLLWLLFAITSSVPEVMAEQTDSTGVMTANGYGIHFIQSGRLEGPMVVFVHGTPGSSQHWRYYLSSPELQNKARLIAVDRPGWGGSVSETRDPEIVSFSRQADSLGKLLVDLKQESGQPLILVGHSLGASLIPQIHLQYPSLVDGMLLINGSVNPGLAQPRWYHRIANSWLVCSVIGNSLRKANREMLALAGNLERQQPVWARIDIPVILIQGGKDFLVNPRNIDFVSGVSESNIDVRFFPEKDHFIPFKSPELVVSAINDLMRRLKSRPDSGLVSLAAQPVVERE